MTLPEQATVERMALIAEARSIAVDLEDLAAKIDDVLPGKEPWADEDLSVLTDDPKTGLLLDAALRLLGGQAVIKRLANALATLPAQSWPAGWKLVPVEPTEVMLKACRDALKAHIEATPVEQRTWMRGSSGHGGYSIPANEKAAVRYRAMLDAAPKP